ncbi:hypothetical protein OIE66_37800 [Nonomuraea sp. NBC_01738]|uniref:hypothetical protein n=1 Tax=Nonomuraea sp. NBC_01738 TaxID=2976003 RepID=UPI002E166D52|nr:hypothetical protein OIE66_37800 [Nonomuraea sp. NBC_01738]
MALLTPDRLVLADLPGRWDGEEVRRFAAPLGLSVFEAGATHSTQARTALAARAPGWIRLAGMPAPPPARWRRPVAVGAGVLGLAAMVYLISIGAGYAWRAFSSVGRVLIDVIEAKWLVVMFSPVLVVLSPVRKRLLRRRLGSGSVIGSVGGLHLDVSSGALRVRRGMGTLREYRIGQEPGQAAWLLLYRHADLAGLFVFGAAGAPLEHLPGPWSPEHVNRFASQHGLGLQVRQVDKDEYAALVGSVREACP